MRSVGQECHGERGDSGKSKDGLSRAEWKRREGQPHASSNIQTGKEKERSEKGEKKGRHGCHREGKALKSVNSLSRIQLRAMRVSTGGSMATWTLRRDGRWWWLGAISRDVKKERWRWRSVHVRLAQGGERATGTTPQAKPQGPTNYRPGERGRTDLHSG